MLDDIKKTLWATADKLRANMDAAEYKHLVLGLIWCRHGGQNFGRNFGRNFIPGVGPAAAIAQFERQAVGRTAGTEPACRRTAIGQAQIRTPLEAAWAQQGRPLGGIAVTHKYYAFNSY